MSAPKKTPEPQKGNPSAPSSADFTLPGRLPLKQNTVTAEVLSRLLNGERLTSLDGVYEASTTRLGAVKYSLEKNHGWHIEATDKAAGCIDGRVAWIVEYHLHPEAIGKAMAAGAAAWRNGVRWARMERRKKAAQAEREAARMNEARRKQRQYIGQSSLFEGPTA